jgi:hypothetical protein
MDVNTIKENATKNQVIRLLFNASLGLGLRFQDLKLVAVMAEDARIDLLKAIH